MAVTDLLTAEVVAGMPRLRGANVAAEIPLRQSVLDEVLRLIPGLPADLRVTIGAGRQILVRSGPFHANVRLAPTLALAPRPRLTVELASQLVAWGLRAVSLPSFVEVSGRFVHVHLAEVPALRALTPLWPHVAEVAFASSPGRLDARAIIRVR